MIERERKREKLKKYQVINLHIIIHKHKHESMKMKKKIEKNKFVKSTQRNIKSIDKFIFTVEYEKTYKLSSLDRLFLHACLQLITYIS